MGCLLCVLHMRAYRGGVTTDQDHENPDPDRIRRWHIDNPYEGERCAACGEPLLRSDLINIEYEAGVMHAECSD